MDAIRRLQDTLKPGEAALIQSDINRRYLSGFPSTEGTILVFDSEALLFLDFRYFEMGEKAQNCGTIPAAFTLCEKSLDEAAPTLFTQHATKRIFYEDLRMTCAELANLQKRYDAYSFEPLGRRVEDLRTVKTAAELQKIRAAQALTEEAFTHVLSLFAPSRTELSLAAEIDCYFLRHGAQSAFETIFVSGQRTSMPHGKPQDDLIAKNSFVTMDFGAKVDGYCADMTRTVVFGKATEEMRELYDLVFRAQNAAFAAIHAGVIGREVDAAARDLIDAAGYAGCFEHGTGHALGLEIHEPPNFSKRCDAPIPAGAVLSVEPGVYLSGKYGVRIEDIVCVTESGYENLTHAQKSLLEIE